MLIPIAKPHAPIVCNTMWALTDSYCAGFLRQQENQQLGIPREIAPGFSPRLRSLVGYGIYRGLIGHVDKCSPVDLLDGTPPRRVLGQ